MSEEKGKRLLAELVNAIQSKDKEKIDKLKYDNLFYGSNLLTIISNYIFLSEIGVEFDFGSQIIKKERIYTEFEGLMNRLIIQMKGNGHILHRCLKIGQTKKEKPLCI